MSSLELLKERWRALGVLLRQARSSLCPADGVVSPETSSSVRPPAIANGAKRWP